MAWPKLTKNANFGRFWAKNPNFYWRKQNFGCFFGINRIFGNLDFWHKKRPNLVQNMLSWAHIGLAGSLGALLVGGCGARAVSRKTPIYFIALLQVINCDILTDSCVQ